jgi:hypothetical protein
VGAALDQRKAPPRRKTHPEELNHGFPRAAKPQPKELTTDYTDYTDKRTFQRKGAKAQRRKEGKNSLRLCVFAPLR